MSDKKEKEILELDSLNIRPMNNMVLVRVDDILKNRTTKGGIIMGDSTWEKAAHTERYGTVVRHPKHLVCTPEAGMAWDTDLEIKEGDIVFFGKMESTDCQKFTFEEKLYFLVNYGELILRKRGDDIYPLNGYAIVDKVSEVTKSDSLILDFSQHQNSFKGVLRYLGIPNRSYQNANANDAKDIAVGDNVVFAYSVWTELEPKQYATLNPDLGYVQRRWIIGKY